MPLSSAASSAAEGRLWEKTTSTPWRARQAATISATVFSFVMPPPSATRALAARDQRIARADAIQPWRRARGLALLCSYRVRHAASVQVQDPREGRALPANAAEGPPRAGARYRRALLLRSESPGVPAGELAEYGPGREPGAARIVVI